MTNGAGDNVQDENDTKSVSARLTYRLAEHLEVGGSVSSHDYPDEISGTDRYAWAWALDGRIGDPLEGLQVKAAAMVGDNWLRLTPSGDEARFLTWQAVAGYRIPLEGVRYAEGIEAVARITQGDPDRGSADDGGWVLTPGLNAYLAERNRISANVDFWRPESGSTAWSFKVQTQFYF